MKRARNHVCVVIVVAALVGFVGACNNTQPGAVGQNNESTDPASTTPAELAVLDNLPQPDPVFHGKIGETYHDAEADPAMFTSPIAPKGAPNILLVLIDDAGFGASSTFGGPCNTPVLDGLARGGLRYNRFHTTALCSPTRAALLTGHNHHSASTGVIMEMGTGFPGYTGIMPRSTATIAQILKNNGYSTAWIGKNHNIPSNMLNNVGPFDRWPNHLGFDYFYGFNGGEADQWYPTLYENLNPVQPWGTPEDGYNLGADQTDKAIAWMNNQKSIAPDRPFFLYYAPGATHAPHHPPKEWAAKYKGKFAMGYDKIREAIFKRQKELGVIPQDAKLTPRMEQLPSWDSHDAQAKKLFERQMEVYAGYFEYTDHQIGRLLASIDKIGQLDNTLVIYIAGDNGGSAEGSLVGTANEVMNLNGLDPTIEQSMKFYDEWGGPETSPHYAVGWAWAMDTPFQWNKQVASHFGGTRNPMVVSWPARIKDKGGLRTQFHHVNDVAPTLLEVVGIQQPKKFNGIVQKPMEGVSFAYTFADDGAKAADRKTTQYFEMMGNRGIYHDGWMASVFHKVPWDTGGSVPFEKDKWELYDLSKDFSQADDLAAQFPEKLKEMQAIFETEGKKFGVFPLDDRLAGRLDVSLRPSWTSARSKFTFYPGMTHLDEGTAPNVKNKSHSITAEVEIPEEGAEGVLLAMGGGTGGYVLYIKDNKFTYYYDFFGYDQYKVESTALPTGQVKLEMDFKYDGGGPGRGGTVTLSVNGEQAGEGRIEKTIPARFGMDTFDIGMDLNAAVARGGIYKTPYKFTGTIDNVTGGVEEVKPCFDWNNVFLNGVLQMTSTRPEDLQIWIDEGRFENINGHNIFVHASGTPKSPGHGVLITHGFPGSSIDWKHVVPGVALHTRVVVSDFLGLGQSDKPTDGTFETYYSLFQKADQVIEVAEREGLKEVVLVIHDMGQTVGAEIMARHEEGKLPFRIKHAIILNGSTLVDMVHFVPEQVKMLEAPDELTEGIPADKLAHFMTQDGLFAKERAPNEALLDVMVAQVRTKHGDRLLTRLNRYQLERKENLQRWSDGLTKLSAPTSVYWGEQDINAKVEMAHKMKELNPDIDLHIWKDCADWPPIEVPERLAKVIVDRLD